MIKNGSSFCSYSLAGLNHGNEIKKKSGGGGAGAAGRVEGRQGAGGENDTGATQGQRLQSGTGAMVKKVEKSLRFC